MSIDNFTNSLIEMAEAVRLKPELEAKISRLEVDNSICHDTIAIKQIKINNLETELAEAKTRLEEAMRDRDKAMFRNLELDEKLDQFASMAGKVLGLVRPTPAPVNVAVAPEPAPVAVAEPNPTLTDPGWIKIDTYPTPEDYGNSPLDPPATSAEPKPYHEYPYSWKPSSMSDEEWSLNGGQPNPDMSDDTWPF